MTGEKTVRLDKLLSNLAYGSRKDAAIFVRQRRLALHGTPIERVDHAIAIADVISGAVTFDGEALDHPSPFTIMLNKPVGYSCSHDEKGTLVYDLLPARWKYRKPAMACAGRLDKYSTGQVIITDDGELLHRIIHPKSHATKHYTITLARPLRGDEQALFATGTFQLQGDPKALKPAEFLPTSDTTGTMLLHEGRYHQIRRMFETLGNEVVALHRFKTGGLVLGDLPEGEYRVLRDEDVRGIFS